MLTFVIAIKPFATLSREILRAQVQSCLCVRGAQVVIALSDKSTVVEEVVAGFRSHAGPEARVGCSVVHDRSLYDAWNRALDYCDTRTVSFLGYGDVVINQQYFELAAEANCDAYFSKVLIHSPTGYRIFGRRFIYVFHWVKQFAAFGGAVFSTGVLRQHRFDANYTVAGDYEFLLRIGSHLSSEFAPVVSVAMPAGGLSESAISRALTEVRTARHSELRARLSRLTRRQTARGGR